ncbi:MAG: phosphate ABC transporter permease PstA [Gemmatimonadaceae bacterium]
MSVPLAAPASPSSRATPPGDGEGRRGAMAARARRTVRRRRANNAVMQALTYVAAGLATLPLIAVLTYIVIKGGPALSGSFFTAMPAPVGESGGGMANAITGTLILLGIAGAIGLPVGIGAGLYLAERRATKLAHTVRFLADVLNGLPSIVMGIFAWELLVKPMHHFSALAGGIALGAMMIPMVTRTTEEMVRLVPDALREAALALGYPRWRTSLSIVLRTALGGIVTGALVAVARIAGETAPLLFTAFGNQFWSTALREPIAALPLQVFTYAISPYDEWHAQAWAGALVLVALVLLISFAARIATRRRHGGGE